jgi:hypothetical protein
MIGRHNEAIKLEESKRTNFYKQTKLSAYGQCGMGSARYGTRELGPLAEASANSA